MGRSFLIRWAAAILLVMATFNPTSLNYFRWAQANTGEQLSLVVLFGLVLFVGYVIYLRATFRSIGVVGIGLVAALVGALLWVLRDIGWISFRDPDFTTWIGLLALSFVMAVGLSWSIIRRRLSGQTDVDDIDDAEA
ncbi:hypothetical protein HMH01_10880 [Halovulum dunhuangense]|uniref:Uncharacterized protein n=1 Tax=Halovulum dunhuangense TaxID=1505036 RepID=A0A849L464_9RHOB|nr:DUF6524 family protein [Halovulum dunhuangense]NNU80941.1 hypothetical protein [Halovulum dunhuangense]